MNLHPKKPHGAGTKTRVNQGGPDTPGPDDRRTVDVARVDEPSTRALATAPTGEILPSGKTEKLPIGKKGFGGVVPSKSSPRHFMEVNIGRGGGITERGCSKAPT